MSYTKTQWVNNSAPKINQTNLNKIEQGVYDNSENIGDLNNLITADKTNLVNAINEIKGEVVWTNSQATSSFPAQTITVTVQETGYTEYELVYCQSTTRTNRQFTTGKLHYDVGSILNYGTTITRAYDIEINDSRSRDFVFEATKDLQGNLMNNQLIPIKIIYYKGE